MECVASIVTGCCNALSGVTFPEVQYRDALAGLTLKRAAKRLTLKKTNRLLLTDMEALALYEIMNGLFDTLSVLYKGIALNILGEIDCQRSRYVMLMRANLSRMYEQQKLINNQY